MAFGNGFGCFWQRLWLGVDFTLPRVLARSVNFGYGVVAAVDTVGGARLNMAMGMAFLQVE